jgi:hypothetical protein
MVVRRVSARWEIAAASHDLLQIPRMCSELVRVDPAVLQKVMPETDAGQDRIEFRTEEFSQAAHPAAGGRHNRCANLGCF